MCPGGTELCRTMAWRLNTLIPAPRTHISSKTVTKSPPKTPAPSHATGQAAGELQHEPPTPPGCENSGFSKRRICYGWLWAFFFFFLAFGQQMVSP